MRNVLYVLWDSPTSRYLEGLFLPIFKALEDFGYRFHVLHFTWKVDRADAEGLRRTARLCDDQGVNYRQVLTSRQPSSFGPFWSAWHGGHTVDQAIRDWKIDCLMPRSILGSLPVLRAKASGVRIVFDADGLAADERVDFGRLGRRGFVYRVLKSIELRMLVKADAVIARSSKGSLIYQRISGLEPNKFFVSVNGRDPEMFRQLTPDQIEKQRAEYGLPLDAPVLVHNGSFGDKYMPREQISIFRELLKIRSDARFLIMTHYVSDANKQVRQSLPNDYPKVIVRSFDFSQVPGILGACDVGTCLIAEKPSTNAVTPIKLGEFLLCGLGIIASPAAGDADLFGQPFVHRFNGGSEAAKNAALWIVDRAERNQTSRNARAYGQLNYSLNRSVSSYHKALRYAFSSTPFEERKIRGAK